MHTTHKRTGSRIGLRTAAYAGSFLLLALLACEAPVKKKKEEHPALRSAKKAAGTDPIVRRTFSYTELSRHYRYVLHFDRIVAGPDNNDDQWRMEVFDARTGALRDSFRQGCAMLYYDTVPARASARSYVTGYHAKEEVVDNDYGDLVVADLNFDGREDLALKTDPGGNSGCFYTYFLQADSGRFRRNDYLTDSVTYFPGTIDAKKKRLITFGHAGACGLGEHRYRYTAASGTYKLERYIYHDICK